MTDPAKPQPHSEPAPAGVIPGNPVELRDVFPLAGANLKDLISDNRFLVVPETKTKN